MAPLSKIETITEEAEEDEDDEDDDDVDEDAEAAEAVARLNLKSGTDDEEVSSWVKDVLRRRVGGQNKVAAAKPALHAARLDQISPMASPALGSKSTAG